MNDFRLANAVGIVLKISIVLALAIGATTKQQYSYYTFLRWLVMISFIYFSYRSFERKQIGLLIYFMSTAILFNTFNKFTFQRETWQLIDVSIAVITCLVMIYETIALLASRGSQ
jgi:hypothetical protein